MPFSRLVLPAASIAAAVAFAPAFAQQHEVGHWFGAPAASSASGVSVQPSFAGGVFVASGDVSGDARPFNGFVSRFPAGGRDALPATPLDGPRLQTRTATQEARQTHYNDITLKNAHVAGGGDRDMTLKGQNILQNAREIRPVAGAGSSDSTTWVPTVQPHTSTSASALPPRMGWGPWEVQPGRALKELSIAGAGHALAGDKHKNEIEILSISAPSSGHAVGASEPLTVGGGRTYTVPTTPLDDARLVSRGPVAGASDSTYEVYLSIKLEDTRVLPVKGPQLKAETGTGGGDSTVWVRMAQPHTTTSVMPPRVGWEAQVVSAPKTALPAGGMRLGPMPGGHGAPTRR